MAGTNLGTAYVSIMPSTKGMASALSSQMSSEGATAGGIFGNSLASTIIKTIAGAGIVASVTKIFKDAIDEGAKLQQSFGGLDTIYGDAADGMKKMAYEASQAGISANDYAEQAVSMGASLKQAFGGDATKAAESANLAIMDMADNAAKMGTDIGSIQNAYQGFAKSNYTMLDNLKLGYGGTKQEMERLLEDANKINEAHGIMSDYSIENLGDVYEAIHVVQEELGLTGVAAQEGAETFSGSMASMKASAKNLMANMALGEDIKEPLNALLESTKNFLVNNLFPMIGNILKQLPGLIGDALMWAFDNIPNLVDSAIKFLNNLAESITNNSGEFKEKMKEIGQAALEMMKNIDWKGLGMAIINLIWTGLQALGSLIWEGLKSLGQTAYDWFKEVDWLQLGKDVIKLIWEGLGAIGSWIWEKLQLLGHAAVEKVKEIDWIQLGKDVIKFIWEGLGTIGHWIWEKLQLLGDTAVTKVSDINWLQLGKDIITFIWDGLCEIGSDIWEKLKEIGDTAVEEFKKIGWVQLGKDIIGLILEGITALGYTIWEGLGEIGKKAKAWFTGDEGGDDWSSAGQEIINRISNSMYNNMYQLQSASDYMASVILTSVYGNYYDYYGVGQNIVAGVVEGMYSYMYVAQQMAYSVANVVTSAFMGVRGFMIGSPSKLMRDKVGKQISAGIAVGIDEGAGMIDSAIDKVARSSVNDFKLDVSQSGTFGDMNGERAETESPITINVYPSAGMDERALADMVQQRLALLQRQKQAAWGTA